jgi:hypothetical protein
MAVCILLHVWDQGRDFRLRNAISVVFTIYSLAATCFGCTTIFKRKYIQWKLTNILKITDALSLELIIIIDLKGAHDSVRREVLYSIPIGFLGTHEVD